MFSDRTLNLTYFYSKTITPELKRMEMGAFADQYAFMMQFRNETRFTIAVVNRAGIRTVLPPARGIGRFPGTFLVRLSNSPQMGIISYVDDQFSAGQAAPDIETDAWKRATEGKPYEHATALRAAQAVNESSVIHQINEQDILSNAGCIYVANLDLVIAVMDGSGKQPPPHPFSRLGSIATVHELTADSFGLTGAAYAIKIVDRRSMFGDRFVNFGGRVVHIRAEKKVTENVLDGVYLTTNVEAMGSLHQTPFVTEYFGFDTADINLPLYRTSDEAAAFGKPEDLLKRELDRERFEYERQKNRDASELLESKRKLALEEEVFARERREHEREMSRRTAEFERLKADFSDREHFHKQKEQEFKTEQMFAKNKMDQQNDSRKMILDTLKFVPAVIGAVIAIYAVIKKLNSDKS